MLDISHVLLFLSHNKDLGLTEELKYGSYYHIFIKGNRKQMN